MSCKQCNGSVPRAEGAHNRRSDRILIQHVDDNYMGDHSEREIVDAGVFCSWECVGAYSTAKESL